MPFALTTALSQWSNLKFRVDEFNVDLSCYMNSDLFFFYFCFCFIFQSCFLIVFLLVGHEPDIPDLIDFMQSGDELKIINAARYLQHLCYSKESVKDKVRYLVENTVSTIYCEFILSNHDRSER